MSPHEGIPDTAEDTLAIAAGAAQEAVRKHRSEQAAGIFAKVDKTTLTALVAFIGVLTTQADHWLASMVLKNDTAIARAVDSRAESICEAQVEALRGEVNEAAEKPPTIADLTEKQREDRARIFVLERILDVGEYRRSRDD